MLNFVTNRMIKMMRKDCSNKKINVRAHHISRVFSALPSNVYLWSTNSSKVDVMRRQGLLLPEHDEDFCSELSMTRCSREVFWQFPGVGEFALSAIDDETTNSYISYYSLDEEGGAGHYYYNDCSQMYKQLCDKVILHLLREMDLGGLITKDILDVFIDIETNECTIMFEVGLDGVDLYIRSVRDIKLHCDRVNCLIASHLSKKYGFAKVYY